MIKLNTPEFKDEAEEAGWWADHADDITGHFEQKMKDGSLTHGATARRLGMPTTTIRLDPQDISLARIQAEKLGLKYQSYLKMIIHEALLKAEAQHHER